MKDDGFASGVDIFEIFNDNLEAFQRIKRVIDSVVDGRYCEFGSES